MKEYLIITAIVANVLAGAIGGVILLVSGWTIILAPFWVAASLKLGSYLIDQL